MLPTHWRSQPTKGSRAEEAARRPLSTVEVPPEEWRAILAVRLNVLIEGPEAATDAVLRALRPHCADPVLWWSDGLPREGAATLIVLEVAALSANDQQRLLLWFDVPGKTQVISTTSQPLFPRVTRGLFLEDLYYRLNVVRLDCPSHSNEAERTRSETRGS